MSVYDHVAGSLSELDRAVVRTVPPGGNWRDLPADFASKRVEQIRASAARGEGSRSTYYGRLSSDRPSYTVSTYFNRPGNGCFIHPHVPRLITIREAARLQGFPDCYRFFGEGRSRNLQVGNAVPPLLAYQLAAVLPRGPMVDLFSGAGGLSLGFEWAGFPVIAAVDNDTNACAAYERNHGSPPTLKADLGDASVHSAVIREIKRLAGSDGVFLVAGGPPCQGFSTAGDCRLDDPRNELVFAFVRAVEQLRPQLVLMENVAALMFRRGRGVLTQVRMALQAMGYDTSVIIAHAEGYGVPQLRRRLFLMAARPGYAITWPKPWRRLLSPGHFEHQPGAVESQHCALAPVSVGEAIGDLPTEVSPGADTPLAYARPPSSLYQSWARGELPITGLVTSVDACEEDQGRLALAVSS